MLKQDSLSKLFGVLAQRYVDRPGGYTRIHKFGNRRGDNAPEAIVELVDNPRGLRWEMTSRAIGWDLLKKKLSGNTNTSLVNNTHADIPQILQKETLLPSKHRGLLREKTRWNLRKLLKYRRSHAVDEIAEKAATHMVSSFPPFSQDATEAFIRMNF